MEHISSNILNRLAAKLQSIQQTQSTTADKKNLIKNAMNIKTVT